VHRSGFILLGGVAGATILSHLSGAYFVGAYCAVVIVGLPFGW
jgi:hypothetical protein